jgi:hypothetical protein
MAAKKEPADDRSLKRLGGGRWQTRDERFTIEPQSGTWVLVDAEQTDDLGLPLVRGPFRSLTDAKAAVESARGASAPESPLADRIKDGAAPRASTQTSSKTSTSRASLRAVPDAKPERPSDAATQRGRAAPEPAEARWIGELPARERGRARRLIERLSAAGVRDSENIVRQDLTGGVPAVARVAIADRLADALASASDGSPAAQGMLERLIALVDNGRDEAFDVHWRLVDGDERRVGLTAADLRAAIKRRRAEPED